MLREELLQELGELECQLKAPAPVPFTLFITNAEHLASPNYFLGKRKCDMWASHLPWPFLW